ncbi:disks large homolog 5-like, partial [Mus pahari]|uniref:disks large homolog 5-like n=1 Tax=Mus pahari TaxID=10093 RepID=UPI000A306B32
MPYYLYKFTSVYLPTRSVAKASPQPPNINEEEKRIKRLEKLKRDVQNIKNERDELQTILANYSIKDLNNRINFETFMLEMQHDQVMTDLKRMPQEISEALDKCKELTKENQFYCLRNCNVLIESKFIQHKVRMLQKDNRQLFGEQNALEECNRETKILCKEGSQKIKTYVASSS